MKIIITPIIVASLMLIIFFSTQTPTISDFQDQQNKADFSFNNVTISLLKKGKKTWTIKAEESQIFNFSSTIFLRKIDGTLFSNDLDQPMLTFTSPLGAYNFNKEHLSMVQTYSSLQMDNFLYLITCDELNLDVQKKLIDAYGNIQINSNQLNVKSSVMIADLSNNLIKLKQNVQGSIISF